MQDLVGIVRNEADMQRALGAVQSLNQRAAQVAVAGNREYNPGWHTALDLLNLLIVSEAITRAALERKIIRGAQFREDYPDRMRRTARSTSSCARAPTGEWSCRVVRFRRCRAELAQIIEGMR